MFVYVTTFKRMGQMANQQKKQRNKKQRNKKTKISELSYNISVASLSLTVSHHQNLEKICLMMCYASSFSG